MVAASAFFSIHVLPNYYTIDSVTPLYKLSRKDIFDFYILDLLFKLDGVMFGV